MCPFNISLLWQVDVKRATPKADGMGGMRGGRGGRGGRGRGRGGECNLSISYGWSLFIGCLQWRISNKQFIKEVQVQTQNAHSLHWCIQIKRLLKIRLYSMLVSNSNHVKNYWSQFNLPPSVSCVKLSPRLTINKIWPSLQTLDEHTLLL